METVWSTLELDAEKSSSGIIKRLVYPQAVCRMFIALEIPAWQRLLMIQIPYKYIKNELFSQFKGFDVQRRVYGDEATQDLMTLVLAVKKPEYNNIFTFLAIDIAKHLSEVVEYSQLVNEFKNRLFLWQSFLDRYDVRGLGEEAQRGLFAELIFLRNYLLSNIDHTIGLTAWTGPKHLPHDFQFSECSLEIKSTISKQHQKLYISNERQLDDSDIEVLFICHFSFIITNGENETLSSVIESIRTIIKQNPQAIQLFEQRLIEAGYLDFHKDQYTSGYGIRENNFFQVREGFPRIIEKDLLRGVGDVKYSVMVSECKHYTIEWEEVLSFIRR